MRGCSIDVRASHFLLLVKLRCITAYLTFYFSKSLNLSLINWCTFELMQVRQRFHVSYFVCITSLRVWQLRNLLSVKLNLISAINSGVFHFHHMNLLVMRQQLG